MAGSYVVTEIANSQIGRLDRRYRVRSASAGMSFDDTPLRNRLLAALSPDDLAPLKPHFETMNVGRRAPIFGLGESCRVLFPETAVVSIVNTLKRGRGSSVGTVGCEGMAGLHLFLGDGAASLSAFADVPGTIRCMDAAVFRVMSEESEPFHRVLLRYTQAFLTQVTQTATCNGTHLVEERCARWLLSTRERVGADKFPLSHEVLAFMLGVREGGVALAMLALRDKQLIRYGPRHVEIIDVAGLEKASCPCHGTISAQFGRLLPPVA